MPDIMLDLARLREAHTGIAASINEFKDASDINDKLEEAIARPDDRSELRGKASDFESAWDGKRDALQENLQNILDQLTAILDGWEKWDTGTASNIESGGTETTGQSGPR